MVQEAVTAAKQRILTVPNVLSIFRISLIPVFVACYSQGWVAATALLLGLSGLTDVVDGWYARRFRAVSDVGKVLDPIADKLTQAAMLVMLSARHPKMLLPLALLVMKELTAAAMGYLVIRHTGAVPSAVWHGKLTTVLLYAMLITHAVWEDIPSAASNTMLAACLAMMFYSMGSYAFANIRRIRQAAHERG